MPFEPKEAGGIRHDAGTRSGVDAFRAVSAAGGGEAMEAAPDSSHIYGWKLADVRFLSPEQQAQQATGLLGSGSILYVIFRDEKSKGPGASYAYRFGDPEQAASVVEALRASAHPYAEVFLPRVRRAGIPYTKI